MIAIGNISINSCLVEQVGVRSRRLYEKQHTKLTASDSFDLVYNRQGDISEIRKWMMDGATIFLERKHQTQCKEI
jgi:hypothetical protein